MNNAGISSDEYDFHDGSGLSRQNLVTPHAVVQLLQYAANQPWGTEFRQSLPVAGIDGSLEDRLKDLQPGVQVFGKTGSLGGVKSLSGYAVTAKGEQLIFSIMSNNESVQSKRVTDAIDSLVEAVVQPTAK